MSKRSKALKELSLDELKTKATELQKQLFKLRLQKATGQLEKTAMLATTRRELARVNTFMTQKAQG